MLGQPQGYDPLADALQIDNTVDYLQHIKNTIAAAANSLPSHAEFIKKIAGQIKHDPYL